MSQQRRRFNTQSFEQQLAEEAERFRKAAEAAPPGMARELLLRRVRQAEAVSHLSALQKPSGLQRPK
jgi:hypothetical protein